MKVENFKMNKNNNYNQLNIIIFYLILYQKMIIKYFILKNISLNLLINNNKKKKNIVNLDINILNLEIQERIHVIQKSLLVMMIQIIILKMNLMRLKKEMKKYKNYIIVVF